MYSSLKLTISIISLSLRTPLSCDGSKSWTHLGEEVEVLTLSGWVTMGGSLLGLASMSLALLGNVAEFLPP